MGPTRKRRLTIIDQGKLTQAIELLISALGDDPTRPGLVETPTRAAKMYTEMFEGMNYTNTEIAQMFNKCFEEANTQDWVLVQDISIFSFCEHHFALMYNMKAHIAYKPKDKVIGLSKIARIANMAAKRLQLQERISSDIAEILEMVLNTKDVMVQRSNMPKVRLSPITLSLIVLTIMQRLPFVSFPCSLCSMCHTWKKTWGIFYDYLGPLPATRASRLAV